jgi:hypothetical protein
MGDVRGDVRSCCGWPGTRAVPVVFARNIYGYYTREYVPSFGTPIGVPFEFWFAEVAGVLGAALLLTAALRGRGRQGLGQRPLAPQPAKPVSWGRVSVLTAATLCVG